LTQLYNRRKFFEESIGYLDQDSNATDHLLVAIMDVDFFKAYNDTFGHAQGDLTLVQLSALLKEYFSRKNALLCRWGGEEFMYVMPLEKNSVPLQVAESVLEYIRVQKLPTANTSISNYLTISMGITTIKKGQHFDWAELYHQCDEALYTAKENGRNQVVSYDNKS